MTREEAIKMFRRVYPESEISIGKITPVDEEHFVLNTYFPDGDFSFVVEKNCVSHSYNSEEEAIRSIR
jgi:hypothetical protein